ncbi:response regulator transcription factor [Evtepia sp.]|uniref:response regulator transcription factor n=1 Tax=Evtepia sp. TaxID=2773933 RepID=UPI001E11F405|nr:response regulator transcription factor [Evtepia sp.]MBD9248021.1 DNA-binding response regulator [Clostridiales bacterium]MEE0256753.1 response regulator transcription factor [Evtepia sp.]
MIYLLEDDDSIRKLVIYALNSQGYEAKGFERPAEFWKAMGQAQPDLVLLDIMLPEEDGLTILQKLRAAAGTKKLPVIMLTAKNTEYDRVVGLDSGADDFISKPFGMMELVARVRAVLRRTESREENSDYQLGELFVSPKRHVVKVDGEEVSLTNKEFELLCLLLEHQGMAMTRDAIMDGVWGQEFSRENRTLDVHVRTLRTKLGPAGHYIETVRGVGYKMGGEGA